MILYAGRYNIATKKDLENQRLNSTHNPEISLKENSRM